jgi:hypothetical protein
MTVGIPKVMQKKSKREKEKESKRRHLTVASHNASHLETHAPWRFNSRAYTKRNIRRTRRQKLIV